MYFVSVRLSTAKAKIRAGSDGCTAECARRRVRKEKAAQKDCVFSKTERKIKVSKESKALLRSVGQDEVRVNYRAKSVGGGTE